MPTSSSYMAAPSSTSPPPMLAFAANVACGAARRGGCAALHLHKLAHTIIEVVCASSSLGVNQVRLFHDAACGRRPATVHGDIHRVVMIPVVMVLNLMMITVQVRDAEIPPPAMYPSDPLRGRALRCNLRCATISAAIPVASAPCGRCARCLPDTSPCHPDNPTPCQTLAASSSPSPASPSTGIGTVLCSRAGTTVGAGAGDQCRDAASRDESERPARSSARRCNFRCATGRFRSLRSLHALFFPERASLARTGCAGNGHRLGSPPLCVARRRCPLCQTQASAAPPASVSDHLRSTPSPLITRPERHLGAITAAAPAQPPTVHPAPLNALPAALPAASSAAAAPIRQNQRRRISPSLIQTIMLS